jgi:8-oxo-dGTP pyrophosphatase MutT (NUDIX family)
VTATAEVQAAGGVVWRRAPSGETEILVVHRPKYDDWSLPKGKLTPGESHEDGARREVAEETGLDVSLGRELATSFYRDSEGRSKVVRYWAMEPVGGEFRPNREVDEARWAPVKEATGLLSYDRDRDIVASFEG